MKKLIILLLSIMAVTMTRGQSTFYTYFSNGDTCFNIPRTVTGIYSYTQYDTVRHKLGSGPVVPPPTGYKLIYSTGYDKLTDITTNNAQYGNGTISTTVYKTGPGSFYSKPKSVSSGIRSEVQYFDPSLNPTEGAVEYDVRYDTVVQGNNHSLQWHPMTDGGSASPGLWTISGQWRVVRWRNGTNSVQTLDQTPGGKFITIPTKVWLHMRWEYKFASSYAYERLYITFPDSRGTILYYDQEATVDSWLGDGSGQYLKVGYNGFNPDPNTDLLSRIYYDNLQIFQKL